MDPSIHHGEIQKQTVEAVQRSAEAAAREQIEGAQAAEVLAKFEQVDKATPLVLKDVEDVSRRIGLQEPTYTRNQVTSSSEPIKPEFGRFLGYRKPVKKTRFQPGIMGYQTETSKLVPISSPGGDEQNPDQGTQNYVEFFVTKRVELRRKPRSRKVERVTTDAVSYGARIYAGPKGLDRSVSTKDLIEQKKLVPVISEADTTVQVSKKLEGATPLAQITRATPNVAKLPSIDTVPPGALIDALSQMAGKKLSPEEADKLFAANPGLRQKLAIQTVRQGVESRGGQRQLAIDNARAHAEAELRKLSLIAYLTEEAKKAA